VSDEQRGEAGRPARLARATARGRAAGLVRAALLALVVGAPGTASGSTFVDPVLRFHVLSTEHFVVYFHQGEERLAQRVAVLAEDVWRALRTGFLAPGKTHILLVDQFDSANGWATPLPRDTILVTAAWPSGAEFTAHTDEWLRTVIEHELTHIAHLGRSGSWAKRSWTGPAPGARLPRGGRRGGDHSRP
jgi:hypothetical protein